MLFCILEITSNGFKLKENHVYHDQVQGQAHVCGAASVDFVVWTTKDCVVVTVVKDVAWAANLQKLIDFYFSRFIPKIVA